MLMHFSLVTLPHAVASLVIFAISSTISVILASLGILDHVHESVWKQIWHKDSLASKLLHPGVIAVLVLSSIIAVVGGYAVWWYQSYHQQSFRTAHDRRVARKAKNAVEAVRSTAMGMVNAVSPSRLLAYEQKLERKIGIKRGGSKKTRRDDEYDEQNEGSVSSGTEYENESEIVARRGGGSTKTKSSKTTTTKTSKNSSRQKRSGSPSRDRSSSPQKARRGRPRTTSNLSGKAGGNKSRSPSKSPIRRLQSY